mmetsp:Transcript_8279/g.17656  ORF Transcript_8279/g.17656 Transcript_8279/m.17656 type:complete len:164 (-) Transcript_8279:175-666(-)
MCVWSLQNCETSHERDASASETECEFLGSNCQKWNSHKETEKEKYRREEEANAEYLKSLLVIETHDFLGELGFEGRTHGGEVKGLGEEGLGFNVGVGCSGGCAVRICGGGGREKGAERRGEGVIGCGTAAAGRLYLLLLLFFVPFSEGHDGTLSYFETWARSK